MEGYVYPAVLGVGILIFLIALFKRSPLFQFFGLIMAIYGALKSAGLFIPPIPGQVLMMYMALSIFALLIFFSIEEETFRRFLSPIKAILGKEELKVQRFLIVYLGIPLLLAYLTYTWVKPKYVPPVSPRIVHPEPPIQIDFKGKTIKILGLENPLRKEADKLKEYLEEGKKIYYQNCFFCHGDDLDGSGIFADAYNPRPLPFRGTDTIAQLPESFVFWRIAKGWKGLPEGSTPWDSAMPSFEDLGLSEEDVWKVILFIYEASGNKPRTW